MRAGTKRKLKWAGILLLVVVVVINGTLMVLRSESFDFLVLESGMSPFGYEQVAAETVMHPNPPIYCPVGVSPEEMAKWNTLYAYRYRVVQGQDIRTGKPSLALFFARNGNEPWYWRISAVATEEEPYAVLQWADPFSHPSEIFPNVYEGYYHYFLYSEQLTGDLQFLRSRLESDTEMTIGQTENGTWIHLIFHHSRHSAREFTYPDVIRLLNENGWVA